MVSDFKKLYIASALFWAIVIFLMGLMTIGTMLSSNEAIPFGSIWFYEFLCISPWILATPIIFNTLHRFPLNEQTKVTTIAIHLALALCVFAFHNVVQVAINHWYWGEVYQFGWSRIRYDFIAFFQLRLLYYLILAIGFYTYQLYTKRNHTHLEESRLRAEITRTKCEQLHANIHPYLMINSIDAAIQACDEHPEQAEHIIHRLSELIRMQLKKMNQELLTVEQNQLLLQKYAELLAFRVSQSLPFESSIEEKLTLYRTPSANYIILLLEELIYHKSDVMKTLEAFEFNVYEHAQELHLLVTLKGAIVDSRSLDFLLHSQPYQLIVQALKQQIGEHFQLNLSYAQGSLEIRLTIQEVSALTNRFNESSDVHEINYLYS